MLVLLFERLLSMGDLSGGGSEHNSGLLNFAKNKRGEEEIDAEKADSDAEEEDRKQSISKKTWH